MNPSGHEHFSNFGAHYQPQYGPSSSRSRPRVAGYPTNTGLNSVSNPRAGYRSSPYSIPRSSQATRQENPVQAFRAPVESGSSQESLDLSGMILIDAQGDHLRYPYSTEYPPIRIKYDKPSAARRNPIHRTLAPSTNMADNGIGNGAVGSMPETAMSSIQQGKQLARPRFAACQVRNSDLLAMPSAALNEAQFSNKNYGTPQTAPVSSYDITPVARMDLPGFGQALPQMGTSYPSPYILAAKSPTNGIPHGSLFSYQKSNITDIQTPTPLDFPSSSNAGTGEQGSGINNGETSNLYSPMDLDFPTLGTPTFEGSQYNLDTIGATALTLRDPDPPLALNGGEQNLPCGTGPFVGAHGSSNDVDGQHLPNGNGPFAGASGSSTEAAPNWDFSAYLHDFDGL